MNKINKKQDAGNKADTNLWDNYFSSITWLFIMIMLTVFPLFLGTRGYGQLTVSKYLFFKLATYAYLTLLLSGIIIRFIRKPSFNIMELAKKSSWAQRAIVVFALTAIVSSIFSPFREFVWTGAGRYDGLNTLLLYVAIFLAISCFGKFSKWYFFGFALSIGIMSVMGILQYCNINVFDLYAFQQGYYNSAFITTIGNTNMTSGMLLLGISLFVGAFVILENKWRWALLPVTMAAFFVEMAITVDSGTMGLIGAALLGAPFILNTRQRLIKGTIIGAALAAVAAFESTLTVSRLSFLDVEFIFEMSKSTYAWIAGAAFCAIVAVTLKIMGDKFKFTQKQLTIAMAILVVAIIIICFVGIEIIGANPENRLIYEFREILHGNFDDNFGSARMYVWKRALTLIPDYPIIGSGPDTFVIRFTINFQKEINQLGYGVYFDFAHNEYIQLAVNLGLLGLFSYLAFLIALATKAIKTMYDNPIILVFALCALCYCCQAFFSFSISIVAPVAWIIFGLGGSKHLIDQQRV